MCCFSDFAVLVDLHFLLLLHLLLLWHIHMKDAILIAVQKTITHEHFHSRKLSGTVENSGLGCSVHPAPFTSPFSFLFPPTWLRPPLCQRSWAVEESVGFCRNCARCECISSPCSITSIDMGKTRGAQIRRHSSAIGNRFCDIGKVSDRHADLFHVLLLLLARDGQHIVVADIHPVQRIRKNAGSEGTISPKFRLSDCFCEQ
jgi:hypothetical protein